VLVVNDARHLQKTLTTLLTAGHLEATQVAGGGVTYYAVAIPNGNTTIKIAYAFVDGYLVIGSGQQVVAEAVALHRSGASLRNSIKFQAALPPGHGLEASAIVYNDPAAMVAMQAKQLPAEVAEPLAQLTQNAAPKVICLYGGDTTIREASKGGQMDAAGVLIVAAVAIPNLLRSKIAANEASAVGSMRSVNTAQVTYAATYPQHGYARDLKTLGTDAKNPTAYSETRAGLLDANLGGENCTATAWCTKSGYNFRVKATCLQQNCADYVVVATPVDTNAGSRSFCSTSSGVIRWKIGGPVATPVSLADCKTWSALQ
jgi:type IV pilus assembly protein PilA